MAKRQREPGRFVTLRSGRVIFIPKGKRSKWADVRDKIKVGEKKTKGPPELKYRIRLRKIGGAWGEWSGVRSIEAASTASAHRKLVGPHLGKIQVEWVK